MHTQYDTTRSVPEHTISTLEEIEHLDLMKGLVRKDIAFVISKSTAAGVTPQAASPWSTISQGPITEMSYRAKAWS